MDLGLHSPHYILYMFATLHFHLTSLVVLFVSSCLSYLLLIRIIFFHPEWWSSSVHYMGDSHVISTIYPMDTDLGILSLRRSPHQREFMLHWHLKVCYPFLMLSLGFLGLHSEHVYLCKKKKKKGRLCVFIFYHCVCWCSGVIWLIMFVDESSYVSFPRPFILCIHFCHMFWEWDKWLSLRSSGSLSIPSLCS